MTTFAQYWTTYVTERARLAAGYETLSLQEKSRRVLGRDNPLLYSSRAVAENMAGRMCSSQALARDVGRQTAQFESLAFHTLVLVPLRRIPLPDAQWIALDFTGQAGGWRYKRSAAVEKFRAAIAGKSPESTCRFLSGGIVASEVLDQLLGEEFSRPGAVYRTAVKQIRCRFQLWVARSPREIPKGACIQVV